MADKPETLEETQARLARIEPGAALPPSVSAPIPTVPGVPGTPYGPPAPGAPAPGELGGVGEFGTAPTRPDPYAASTFTPRELPPLLPPTVAVSRRPVNMLAIGLGVVALVVVAGVVAYNAFRFVGEGGAYDPSGSGEPVYSEEWQEFPGVSYIDPNEALEQASYEEVVAGTEAIVTEFRETLTAELGLVWTQKYDGYSNLESNGYGGDSMLYYYDTGSWQGQVQLDDPAARQRVFEIFSALAAANGGDDVLLRNELYADDPEMSEGEFGAAVQTDQALWSFFDSFPALADVYVSVDVMDRTLPVVGGFDGDYMFDYDESTDTFYVVVFGYVGALLKEGDRAAFEEALEPYHGDYEP